MKSLILDSSSLTELHQAGLLTPLIQAKSPVLLCDYAWATCKNLCTKKERRDLEAKGLMTQTLDGTGVEQVFQLFQQHPAMTRCNCFSLILASTVPQSVLVSNCKVMQALAASRGQMCKPLTWARKDLKAA